MKKKLTILGSLISVALFASASDFVILVEKNDSINYDTDLKYTDTVTYSSWLFNGVESCTFDLETSDIYFGESFSQTEICDQEEDRTKTTTREYSDGSKKIVNQEKESRINTINKGTSTEIGTHLEKTCKDVKSFNALLSSGYYTINPSSNMQVYCDMTTSGGGWTVISKESGSGINEALYTNAPSNEGNPSASQFRMSRSNMNLIQSLSSDMRIDCRGSDHLETSSINLFNGEGGASSCSNNSMVTYTSASLKGNHHTNKAICTWYTGIGSGAGRGCAGAFHIDEHAQAGYCGASNYPWTGAPITNPSTDTFALHANTKDSTTDCHKSGAERYIMVR